MVSSAHESPTPRHHPHSARPHPQRPDGGDSGAARSHRGRYAGLRPQARRTAGRRNGSGADRHRRKTARVAARACAAEKEQELDKHLDASKRVEVTRQRNRFMQWLSWIMSEETLRKLRSAFLASPSMERTVRNIGQDLANFGLQTQLTDKRDPRWLCRRMSAKRKDPSAIRARAVAGSNISFTNY